MHSRKQRYKRKVYNIMKFAIFGNCHNSVKSKNIASLFTSLTKKGDSYAIDRAFYMFLKENYPHLDIAADIIDDDNFTADIVISYGGDGTLLRTVARVGEKAYPILGINAGRLGFLTTISSEEIEQTIDNIHNGRYRIEQRNMIEVESQETELNGYPYALNEIAVMKHDSSSMMTLETTFNNNDSIIYQADGLIVSSPSGSTGYSLSVGGPIIAPDANVMVLTPIASHSLNARPIVVNDDTEITIKVNSRSHNFLIAIDGRHESCPEKTLLKIRKAHYKIRLIRNEHSSFIQNLRNKMMLGADSRE